MAALRSQVQTENQGRSLADFPEHAAAIERLAEIEQQLGAAQIDLGAARELSRDGSSHDQRSELEAAAALLAGGSVAVDVRPPVAELSRTVRVLELAARQQSALVSEIAARLEKETTATDERAEFDAGVRDLVQLLQQVIPAHQRLAERRSSIQRRFAGACSLPNLNLQGDTLRTLPHAIQVYVDGARHLGIDLEAR